MLNLFEWMRCELNVELDFGVFCYVVFWDVDFFRIEINIESLK